MPDINKIIDNPNTSSPARVDRELDLEGWNEDQGGRIAEQEGITLTDEHLEVVHWLRRDYLEQGPAPNGRALGDRLDQRFAERGGRAYLRRLFPNGPVAQGMRIAGLPLPPHTEDEGFGVSR
jgi:tRNA 2-thiouridine synthesizing protein E